MTLVEIKRLALVRDLLDYARPLEEISAQLSLMAWDYEGNGTELARQHLSAVLRRYLEEVLLAKDIETWANLIEAREDVYFEVGCEQQIGDVLHELANPTLTVPLDANCARSLIKALQKNE